jgi:flagellar basal body-associated protein FliL
MENYQDQERQQEENSKKKSNVIYFLIAVVIALVGTNAYIYFQKSKSDQKIVYQNDEKTRLQTELDSLEVQLEQVNSEKTKITAELQTKNEELQTKIEDLRKELSKGKLSQNELVKAKEDIKQLRYFVTKYSTDIEELKRENLSLTQERDTLKTNIARVSEVASNLAKQNEELSSKVQVASALKTSSITVTPFRIRNNGKEVDVTRANTAKKIRVDFTIAINDVASREMHDVYMRIIDPTGNQLTGNDSGAFNADGQELQYTYRTSIDYKGDGSMYTISWVNPADFEKGTYTIILYADGFTMGRTSFNLK